MNAADFVIASLEKQGVRDVFLLPGGGCMYLVDSLHRSKAIKSWPLLHEQSVGIAAEAYSQFNNTLGVALVTTGPGGTNALTACAAAWLDSTPVLFLSGQVKTTDSADQYGVRQLGFQEIPITEMVRTITKAAVRVSQLAELPQNLSELISIAQSGRPGPVWLDIPLDIQSSQVDYAPLEKIEVSQSKLAISDTLVENILEEWKLAERPILMLGNGIRLSGGLELIKELMQESLTPILLTWKALDFLSEENYLNAGRPGAIAQRWSNFAQQTSDFMLIIGARLDLGQIAYRPDNFAPKAKKYIVDVDKNELRKHKITSATFLNVDAYTFLTQILKRIRGQKLLLGNLNWVAQIHDWKERYPLVQPKHLNPSSGVNLYEFVSRLSDFMKDSDIFVPGSSGACSEVSMQGFMVKSGQRVFNSEGLGPMGFGVPAPIGACIASGFRRTISIDGDGGFLMNIQELATIELHNLPIKIFVLNNDGYGSIKTSQDRYFEGRRLGTDRSTGLAMPRLEGVIKGFGLKYKRISCREDLTQVLDVVFADFTPMVIEVFVDPMQQTEPRVFTEIKPDGKMLTAPMENLHPLIDESILRRELFFENKH
jgi:acetolactate synthase-1/2/3 large subunit